MLLFTNNAASTLTSGITLTDTTLTVQPGEGALFPSPSGSDSFIATIQDGTAYEFLICTSRSGDVLTIQRGKDGTAAQSWDAGASVDMRMHALVLQAFHQKTDPRLTVTDDGIGTTGALTVTKGAAVAGDLTVGGNAAIAGSGLVGGALTITGALAVGGDFTVSKGVAIGGAMTVKGPISAAAATELTEAVVLSQFLGANVFVSSVLDSLAHVGPKKVLIQAGRGSVTSGAGSVLFPYSFDGGSTMPPLLQITGGSGPHSGLGPLVVGAYDESGFFVYAGTGENLSFTWQARGLRTTPL